MKKRVLFLFVLLIWSHIATLAFAEGHMSKVVFAHTEWKPFIYTDSSGVTQGLFKEILDELFEEELIYHSRPWKRAQVEVEDGVADMMVTVATEERLSYSVKSDLPFYQFFMSVYAYQNHPKLAEIHKITSANDIRMLGLIPVTNLGNGWHKQNIDKFGVKTYYTPKDENIAFVLANKRADIMMESAESMNQIIKENGLTNKIVLTDAKFGPINLYLLVSKKSQLSKKMPQINEAYRKLYDSGMIEQITKKYTSLE